MSKPVMLHVVLRTVTPLFLGGAFPNEFAELRAPSLKGALRFWYRAIDPNYREREPSLFGNANGTDGGQAKFLLRIAEPIHLECQKTWAKYYYERFSSGIGTYKKNGINYLGYSFKMGDNNRRSIPAGQQFQLTLYCKKSLSEVERKAILSALWLLGHIGGLGSRARRGFGTVALQSWQLDGQDTWPELNELPLAHAAKTADGWLKAFDDGLKILKKWFPANDQALLGHTHLGIDTRFYLLNDGHDRESITWYEKDSRKNRVYQPWEAALAAAGLIMQEFRQRSKPDYERVKAYLSDDWHRLNIMPEPPERAAFGLPLTFRYNSLKNKKVTFQVTFQGEQHDSQGEQHDRSASPLFITVVEIAGRCYPFFALLDAPLLSPGEKITDSIKHHKWEPPPRSVLDKFCKQRLQPQTVGKREIRW